MKDSQKFIAENRAPRVQIAYDVEVSGETKMVELPFVMGVLADLSGHDANSLPPLNERSFVDIDVTNLDRRMREITPSLFLQVKNQLTGEGAINTDLKFTKMDDFRPDEVARQVPALRKMLEAREKLAALLAYMDGKAGAEELLRHVLQDKSLLEQLGLPAETSAIEDAAAIIEGEVTALAN